MVVSLSRYQQAALDWVMKGTGDGMLGAVAGSGKTFSLIQAAKLIRGTALFCAFSKEIQLTIDAKLKEERIMNIVAKTIHSLGYSALHQHVKEHGWRPLKNVDGRKYTPVIREALDKCGQLWDGTYDDRERETFFPTLTDLVDYTRVTLTDPDNYDDLEDMAAHFGVDVIADALYELVADVLREGERLARIEGVIDFTDMVWLYHRWNCRPGQLYMWIMVDEAQDLNAAQLELVLTHRAPGGRTLWVGDKKQAIYGFSGADANSMLNIKNRVNARVMPLSICYRCPVSHLDIARMIVPQLEASSTAIDGDIGHLVYEDIFTSVQEGDLIICRKTAPLLQLVIQLISKRIPARVKGRDIGKKLAKLAGEIGKKCLELDDFPDALEAYENREMARLQKKPNSEAQQIRVSDEVACLFAIWDTTNAKDIAGMIAEIDALFSDTRASVWLMTAHRAKGLENDRVFLLQPEYFPLRWKNQLDWQLEQEYNLEYVALTRAKKALYFVHSDGMAEREYFKKLAASLLECEAQNEVDLDLDDMGFRNYRLGLERVEALLLKWGHKIERQPAPAPGDIVAEVIPVVPELASTTTIALPPGEICSSGKRCQKCGNCCSDYTRVRTGEQPPEPIGEVIRSRSWQVYFCSQCEVLYVDPQLREYIGDGEIGIVPNTNGRVEVSFSLKEWNSHGLDHQQAIANRMEAARLLNLMYGTHPASNTEALNAMLDASYRKAEDNAQ